MHTTVFARLAAACHPSVPADVAYAALAEAKNTLWSMGPIDAARARGMVRAVLDSGSEELAKLAFDVLPAKTSGNRQLPTSTFSETVTDAVAADWAGGAPSQTAVRLWLWANNLEGDNGFVLLCRTGAGSAQDTVTGKMQFAIALASIDDLDWSVPAGRPTPLLQLLRWRLSGLGADLAGAIGPIDARLATLATAFWVQAWKGDSNVLALPVLNGFAAGPELAAGIQGATLGMARKNQIANSMPTTMHGVLTLFHTLPDRAAYEAMEHDARVAALRSVMGTREQVAKLSWAHHIDSPDAQAKRAARAAKKAAKNAAALLPAFQP